MNPVLADLLNGPDNYATRYLKTATYQAIVNVLCERFELEPITVKLEGRMGKALGRAIYQIRVIQINPLADTPETVEDTLKHEVAHFLSYDKFGYSGHGEIWKQCAITVGARPSAYQPFQRDNLKANAYRYIYACPSGCRAFANRIRPIYETRNCAKHHLPFVRSEIT